MEEFKLIERINSLEVQVGKLTTHMESLANSLDRYIDVQQEEMKDLRNFKLESSKINWSAIVSVSGFVLSGIFWMAQVYVLPLEIKIKNQLKSTESLQRDIELLKSEIFKK